MQIMGLVMLLALPGAYLLRGAPQAITAASSGTQRPSTGQAIRTALANRSYLMLSAGFFVCGFHVAFPATHLPGVVAACRLPAQYGAWSLAMVGLFNIVGSLAMGWTVGRWRMKSLLALVNAARAVAILLFLMLPKTGAVMLVFAALMGRGVR